jgi:hypothetical protein
MPPDAAELDEVELFGAPADAPCNLGLVRMNLVTLDVPLVLPDVPVAEGSFVEACAWLCSMQPVTVIWSFFGDSGGRETGGDCGGRVGGSPGTRGGCATGGACSASSNIVDWACEGDGAVATNTQLKTIIVQILIPIPHPPIGLANPRTSATSAPDRTQQQAAHTATEY